MEDGAAALISTFTIEGRKAVNILADAYGLAVYRAGRKDGVVITKDHIHRVSQISRLTPYAMEKASDVPAVGKIFGLGVSGYLGSAIEIEAVAFPAREAGKGYYRFNDTAGSMAKDSMFNAAAVVRGDRKTGCPITTSISTLSAAETVTARRQAARLRRPSSRRLRRRRSDRMWPLRAKFPCGGR